MKATCKLCGATIETPADNIFDKDRDARERRAFFRAIAAHIEPAVAAGQQPAPAGVPRCTADIDLVMARRQMVEQDNGWFQRWRLAQAVETEEPHILEKTTDWHSYFLAMFSANAPAPRPLAAHPLDCPCETCKASNAAAIQQ
jgi:hypothetical protein